MKTLRKIELLAPAGNLEAGIAAVDHGADAVYIGAPHFSARAAAGNSIEDIRQLIGYAHTYRVKVYVALNTIIYDDELLPVEKMIRELYRAGADALIVQDMGILNLDIPPIPLHASTQCDNRTADKVRFLEEAGFSQIVLARELSLDEIREICLQMTAVPEVFVHGALCVSYSGQCYISQKFCNRSANRGECAQFCRLPYTLKDATGKVIASEKHLLSLKDLNRSEYLEELLDAGVISFKIEGRLKETSYVKNVTAYYRKKLDAIFERRPEFGRASSGDSTPSFLPDPAKSFNRGFTDYFLLGRDRSMGSVDTPKSLGEPVGNVKDLGANWLTIRKKQVIHNGDGLCFLNERKELQGFRVNRSEGDRIFPAEMPSLLPGTPLYRNFNQEFERNLSKKSAERKIALNIILRENNFGYTLELFDEDLCSASVTFAFPHETSRLPQKENIGRQLSKLGNTPFKVEELSLQIEEERFIPSSLLAEARRRAVELLLSVRKIRFPRAIRQKTKDRPLPLFPQKVMDYRGNVANSEAHRFYLQRGVTDPGRAFETPVIPVSDLKEYGTPGVQKREDTLMFTRYCIKYQLGICPRQEKSNPWREPFVLTTGRHRMVLQFDCLNCEMRVKAKD